MFPAIGALVCFGILLSIDTVGHVVGIVWIAIGIVYYCVVRYGLHRDITLA